MCARKLKRWDAGGEDTRRREQSHDRACHLGGRAVYVAKDIDAGVVGVRSRLQRRLPREAPSRTVGQRGAGRGRREGEVLLECVEGLLAARPGIRVRQRASAPGDERAAQSTSACSPRRMARYQLARILQGCAPSGRLLGFAFSFMGSKIFNLSCGESMPITKGRHKYFWSPYALNISSVT